MHLVNTALLNPDDKIHFNCIGCGTRLVFAISMSGQLICKQCIIKAAWLFSEGDMKPKIPGEEYPKAKIGEMDDCIGGIFCRCLKCQHEELRSTHEESKAAVNHQKVHGEDCQLAKPEDAKDETFFIDLTSYDAYLKSPLSWPSHHPKVWDESEMAKPDPTDWRIFNPGRREPSDWELSGRIRARKLVENARQRGLGTYDFAEEPEMERHLL